jgi:hypothetical protein
MTVGFSSFKANLISQILFVMPLAQFQLQTVRGILFFFEWLWVEGGFFTDCVWPPIWDVGELVEFVVEELDSKFELAFVVVD